MEEEDTHTLRLVVGIIVVVLVVVVLFFFLRGVFTKKQLPSTSVSGGLATPTSITSVTPSPAVSGSTTKGGVQVYTNPAAGSTNGTVYYYNSSSSQSQPSSGSTSQSQSQSLPNGMTQSQNQ